MSAVVFLLITRSMFIGNGGEWWNACFASIKEESSGGSGGWLDIWLLSLFRLFQAMASTAAIIVLLVFVDFWTLNIPRPLHIFVSFNHKKKRYKCSISVCASCPRRVEILRLCGPLDDISLQSADRSAMTGSLCGACDVRRRGQNFFFIRLISLNNRQMEQPKYLF